MAAPRRSWAPAFRPTEAHSRHETWPCRVDPGAVEDQPVSAWGGPEQTTGQAAHRGRFKGTYVRTDALGEGSSATRRQTSVALSGERQGLLREYVAFPAADGDARRNAGALISALRWCGPEHRLTWSDFHGCTTADRDAPRRVHAASHGTNEAPRTDRDGLVRNGETVHWDSEAERRDRDTASSIGCLRRPNRYSTPRGRPSGITETPAPTHRSGATKRGSDAADARGAKAVRRKSAGNSRGSPKRGGEPRCRVAGPHESAKGPRQRARGPSSSSCGPDSGSCGPRFGRTEPRDHLRRPVPRGG